MAIYGKNRQDLRKKDMIQGHKNSLCIFLRASCTLMVGGAVSGWGVITLTTLHLSASNPAAITLSTTSLLVKMPAILGAIPPTAAPSITQTAVVRLSFMIFATSLTVVFGPTVAGCVRESPQARGAGKH